MLSLPSSKVRSLTYVFVSGFTVLFIIFLIYISSSPPSITPTSNGDNDRQLSNIDIAYSQLVSLPLPTQLELSLGRSVLPYRHHCFPFLFPRPTSSIFITGWSNHGAGLGHQFGEWLYAPAVALTLNITYVHTGFLGNSGRWAKWLGFGAGEDEEVHIHNAFTLLRLLPRSEDDQVGDPRSVEQWAIKEKDRHDQKHNTFLSSVPSSYNNSGVMIPIPTTYSEGTLLRVYRIHVPHPAIRYSCHPELNLLLRQKYCAARIHKPVTQDLYITHRAEGRIIVAFHLRCGDSCYNPYRATSFPSIITTIKLISDTIKSASLGPVAFHLFSQAPQNNTAENHFAPLLSAAELTDITIVGHFHTHAHVTLHHLVSSDVLIGAQSSFSWVGSLLHHTVTMGPIPTCRWQVRSYDRETGQFDTSSFLLEFNASRSFTPQFRSMADCYKLQKWNIDLRPDEIAHY